MPMKLLIIHDITTVTRLVQFIRTEYSDADVDWFSSALDASMILQNNKYDAVLCGLDMSNMNGIAFKKNLDASINRGVPYIVLTPSGGADRRQELAGHGIEHILALPCAALELRNMIDRVTDSRSKRMHTRYSIPDTTAAIRFGDSDVRADVVNISIDGILCELDCTHPALGIMTPAHMSVRFPAEYGKDILKDIAVSLLRLTVRSWRADHSPDRVSIVFRFHDMPDSYLAAMETAFAKAGQDLS